MNNTKKSAGAKLREISKYSDRQIKKYEKLKKRKNIPEHEYLTKMRDENNLVEFDNVCTWFFTDVGTVRAVDGVSFDIPKGKTIGIVGESGCGKSVTSLSLMRLVHAPTGQIVSGEIRYNTGKKAVDITKLPIKEMQKIRGNEIGMIFQEPMTSLNPVFTIGMQIDEAIKLHNPKMTKADVKNRTLEMLDLVGIAEGVRIYKCYPHELSGGMRQRVMIAMTLACDPQLIIADEPTTALDVTIQAQILDLLRGLKDKINASIMLITHDLGVVAEMADYVAVMYAGRIIEKGTAEDIFLNPSHPYTVGLMESKPVVGREVDKLYSIPGNVPNPINLTDNCYFHGRCEKCTDKCAGVYPPLVKLSETHYVACYLYEKSEEAGIK
jgi:peptide/nickel transport system ATP-binding protein